ncbi:MAG: putative nucleotidyltransferase substrate binding domain-containing protein [Desulfuromonadales bacterium]|nr:putative nucleotidyltransferase substrate binding domain-containing protein [Desulfuromonadales bacterium]
MPLKKHLRETEPFDRLSEEGFSELARTARSEVYPAGTFIFHQKDPPTGWLYIVRSGLVEIVVHSPGGGDMVVDYRKEGEFFGGTPIFSGETYTGGARAALRTECWLIPAATLKAVAARHPRVGAYFTRIVLSRIRQLYSQIVTTPTQGAPAQLEAYPFKKRLSEIMTTPVLSVPMTLPALEIAPLLTTHGIGLLAVVDAQNRPVGLVSERELVRHFLVEQQDPRPCTAADLMLAVPALLPPDAYMFEAMALMQSRRLKALFVVADGELAGIVTPRDLLHYRSQEPMLLLGNVREEATLAGLAQIRNSLPPLVRSFLAENRGTPEILEVLTYIHHGIMRRTCELTLAQLAATGVEPPAVRWSLLVMGSAGRREMLLSPDQDHGLIWEDLPAGAMARAAEEFFARFGATLTENLLAVGYPLCDGGVMASNPPWRGTLRTWKRRIQDWVNDPEPMKIRSSSIFFDFLPLYGEVDLAHDLRVAIASEIEAFEGFLYQMMTLDLRHKVPLSLLGRFVLEKSGEHQGEISIKQGGLIYLVDCIRIFALERRLPVTRTLDRLSGLEGLNVFDNETAEHVRAAFEALSYLRLRNELAQFDAGQHPSSYLNPLTLAKPERELLKEALQAVSKLQDATRRHFARSAF